MILNHHDTLVQLDNLLSTTNQAWLFGAGISLDAGIPLMGALTERVFKWAEEEGQPDDHKMLEAIKSQLIENCHIEHILSHIGDHRAIAERSKSQEVTFGAVALSLEKLDQFHRRVLNWVAQTVRWGYRPTRGIADEEIGTHDNPIVNVEWHSNFVASLFNQRQKGIADRRRAVKFFTTNYDTLLEDALALGCFPYWDGFCGGALAFRNYRYGADEPDQALRAHVIKLHGSIDWHLGEDGRVWRVRDRDRYPGKASRVLIYPQSTKYLATQRDPFAAQFDLFRRTLSTREENVFATCGYSFGDEHINQEIELLMDRPENKTTILAFSQTINPTLDRWRRSAWNKRIYIIAEDGLHVGENPPVISPKVGEKWDWWTFNGLTQLLTNGPEAFVV